MSAGTSSAKRLFKWLSSPFVVSLLIALFVFIAVALVWQTGRLQFLEFHAYDFLIRRQPKATGDNSIVLVEMTENDIHSPALDYPIHDDKLAELLRNLEAAKPAVVGLDIWRDIPVPKSGEGLPQFNHVLQTYSNIIVIFTLDEGATEGQAGIPPPAILQSNFDRIAFNDNFPPDVDVDRTVPKVRRATLIAETASGQSCYSLPFQLALLYLQQRGIEPLPVPGDATSFRLGKGLMRAFQPTDGSYVGADAKGSSMLLDFKSPENFSRYSFSEILAGHIPPEKLRDKIIIIGMKSVSVSDERVTPIHRNHRGIDLQAMTVNQLLRSALNGDQPLRFWNDWVEHGWILLWCMIGGAAGYWVRSSWRFAATVLLCLAGLAWIVWTAFAYGWWIPAVTPALGFVPATALVVSYISAHERSMRSVLMKLYSRHVSKEIAESVWENRDSFLDGSRPRAQKLVVTVLFTDLKGFSTISEKLEPARLYEWLNGYLGAMAQVIQNHGGVLKQFTGDGILALFGVPVPHTTVAEQSNDAMAAARCALAMGRRVTELSKGWHDAGLPAVSMRVGIYTGEVAAGSVGSDDRFEYAVIGDVVNTASRLESYDKTLANPDLLPNRCRILIGAPTHELLGGKFESHEIGLLEMKGKANKVPVFQILNELSDTRSAEMEAPSATALAK
jgi:adenylate cyclase